MNALEVYGTEFYVCDKSLGFIATDRERNIAVFGYHPEARETSGVSRLVRKADVHVGSNINQLFRIKAKVR
jgi:cleavage and polyadenylation specificity factor subunit 1